MGRQRSEYTDASTGVNLPNGEHGRNWGSTAERVAEGNNPAACYRKLGYPFSFFPMVSLARASASPTACWEMLSVRAISTCWRFSR